MYVFVVSRYPNLVYILLEKIECRQDEAVLNWKLPILAIAFHLRFPQCLAQLKPAWPNNLPKAAAKTLTA